MSAKDSPPNQGAAGSTLTKPAPTDDAFRPIEEPKDVPGAPPWEKAAFKKKVLEAGFPGNPATDSAFLAALYKFGGGKVEEPKEEHKK